MVLKNRQLINKMEQSLKTNRTISKNSLKNDDMSVFEYESIVEYQ